MKFKKLALLLEEIEKTSSRLSQQDKISSFLKRCPKSDIGMVCHFIIGEIAAPTEDLNLGMATRMVSKSIAKSAKKEPSDVESLRKRKGDVGLAAAEIIKKAFARLTVTQVFDELRKIANMSGKTSQDKKLDAFAALLKRATSIEAKYLCRIATGTMRLGASTYVILDSLAIAFTGDVQNRKEIESAYNKNPNIGDIAKMIASQGLKGIGKVKATLARPIKMMLAQRVKKIDDITKKLDCVVAEEKYDGERIQAHKNGENVVLFSRRMENISSQFPDIVELVNKQVKAKKAIIEGEVVAVSGNKLLPFQVLMQRRRKYKVEEYRKKIPICYYVFECLYVEKNIIKEPYPVRRAALKRIVKENSRIQLAKQVKTNNIKKIQVFFRKSLKRGCEGIIAKSCEKDSGYRAGARAWQWIKWKKEYVSGMRDSFDLVVVAGFYGRGKRTGSYGALLGAIWNVKTKKYETLCKIGSGFTDKMLAELLKKLNKYEIKKIHSSVSVAKGMKPDVWFRPGLVIEVIGAELTKSTVHTAMRKDGKGLALRFPRFVRIRSDKGPKQATKASELKSI